MTTSFPSLRSSAPRERVDPAFDYRSDLNYREDRLDRLSQALDQEARLLREERDRLEQRERALERRELARELADEQQPHAGLPFDPKTLPRDANARTKMLADWVILAGKRRRNEIPNDPPLPTHPVARAIALAGMRRRGEIVESKNPENDIERLIALGRKRCGEI